MIEFTKWKKPEIITFDWYAKEFKLPSSSNQNEQKEQIIAWINQATDMVNNITNNVVYDYYPILEDKAKNGTISEAEERSVHFLQQAIGKTVEYISMLGGFNAYMKELMDNNVRICTIGHLEMAPQETQDIINRAIEETKNNTGLKLCFAFIYGGRDEIVHATKKIALKLKNDQITVDDIDENLFASELMTCDLPDVDLMIRTSGEQRLSNFLLWQLAYAEFIFTDVYWPDFNADELTKSIWLYQNRERRFGGLK